MESKLETDLFNAIFDNAWELKTENVVPKCNEICEKFAIDFVEWLTSEKSVFAVCYGADKRLSTFDEDFTIEQVLEIYKKQLK